MKSSTVLKLSFVLSCNIFLFLTAEAQLPSQMRAYANASLDLIKVNNKGQSYIDAKDLPRVGFNIKMDMMYKFSNNDYGPVILNSIPKTSMKQNSKESFFASSSVDNEYSGDDYFAGNNLYVSTEVKKRGSFYLSGSLEFIIKASKETQDGFTTTTSLDYLQLPILINYSYPLDMDNSVHGGIGFYAALGLSGHFKSDGMSESVHFGSSPNSDDLRRMDYGLVINAGYSFLKKWDVTLNYDLGLRNVSATPPDPNTKIRGFSLNAGYRIL